MTKFAKKGEEAIFSEFFVFQYLCAKSEPPILRLFRPLVKEYIAILASDDKII